MSTLVQDRLKASRGTRRFSAIPLAVVLAIALTALMGALWLATARTVAVTVDGVTESVRTHRRSIEPLMLDLGLSPQPQDRISPDPSTGLADASAIGVERAPTMRVLADGRDMLTASWGATPREVLLDAGIVADSYDQVVLDGTPHGLDAPLPAPVVEHHATTYDRGYAWSTMQAKSAQLRLYRSIPINVYDGGIPFTVRTTAETVGEALREAAVTIYLGDRVQPSMGSSVNTGLSVFIERSIPVAAEVSGQQVKTRVRGQTVADALSDMEIDVTGLDEVQPDLAADLYDNILIRVKRIAEDVEVEEEIAPFETFFEPDPNLLIDTQRQLTPGAEGVTRTRYRVRYEDGEEVDRVLEDRWVAQEPAERRIAYGQKIVPGTFTTDDGRQLTYWRKIRMAASSYSAGTAGVSPDKPWYGRTFTGEVMRFGIVAVDPAIIPLRTQVYVPGYGTGDALDMGSAIRSRRIDLGYDDSNLVLWNKWVDVYLLWPPPPDYQISWVIPNWPRVPQ